MKISTVAVGLDGSATAAKAVEMAAELTRRFDGTLVLLSAFRDLKVAPASPASDSAELQWATNSSARTREILARTEARLRREGINCSTMIGEGDPADVLVKLAAQSGADVLVVGNRGMQRRLLGSVPNTVTHNAACSVLVVKTT